MNLQLSIRAIRTLKAQEAPIRMKGFDREIKKAIHLRNTATVHVLFNYMVALSPDSPHLTPTVWDNQGKTIIQLDKDKWHRWFNELRKSENTNSALISWFTIKDYLHKNCTWRSVFGIREKLLKLYVYLSISKFLFNRETKPKTIQLDRSTMFRITLSDVAWVKKSICIIWMIFP